MKSAAPLLCPSAAVDRSVTSAWDDATSQQPVAGPQPIAPALLGLIAGGSPRGGWMVPSEMETLQSPRGGW
jgi:hypothetical protein